MGGVAGAYHSSSGRLRLLLRLFDYYSIALSSSAMRRAMCREGSKGMPRISLASIAACAGVWGGRGELPSVRRSPPRGSVPCI